MDVLTYGNSKLFFLHNKLISLEIPSFAESPFTIGSNTNKILQSNLTSTMKALFSNLNVNDHQIKAVVTIGGQKQDISLTMTWNTSEVTGTVGDGSRESRIKQVIIDKINAIYLYQE